MSTDDLLLGPMLRWADATSATIWVETGRAATVEVVGEWGSGKSTIGHALMGLLPAGAEPDFRDPSGTIRVDHIPVPEAWVGNRTVEFQMQSRSRIAWIDP